MISCHNHDYIEIACMYQLEVSLLYSDGESISGKAVNTTYNKNNDECIVLETSNGQIEVILERLKSMKAIRKNPHFSSVDFS